MQVNDEQTFNTEQVARKLDRVRAPLPMRQVREALNYTANSIGERVRELREEAGLSQAALAAEVSELLEGRWHQTAVAKVEAGTRPLKLDELLALTLVFRLSSPSALLTARTGDLLELMLSVAAQTERHRIEILERVLRSVTEGLEGLGLRVEPLVERFREQVNTPADDLYRLTEDVERRIDADRDELEGHRQELGDWLSRRLDAERGSDD